METTSHSPLSCLKASKLSSPAESMHHFNTMYDIKSSFNFTLIIEKFIF